jgi:hypothetical protein
MEREKEWKTKEFKYVNLILRHKNKWIRYAAENGTEMRLL